MTPNEGLQDRIIRCMIGLTVTAGALMMGVGVPTLSATGIMNLLFLVFGVEVLATGITGWSPLYAAIGFSTNGRIGT
jgi:DUF2892 family protein